jgi:hypothetical protein
VAAEHETTAQADGAEGIDTIGVLEDLCFESSWGDLRGETVGLDGVVNVVEVLGGVGHFAEELDSVVGGEERCLGALRRVFGNMNAIVEPSGGKKNFESKVFDLCESAGV